MKFIIEGQEAEEPSATASADVDNEIIENGKQKEKKVKILNKLASKKSIQNMIIFLEKLLNQKKFFKPPEKKKSMILNINNIFGRLELSDKEMRILFSIFSALNKKQ